MCVMRASTFTRVIHNTRVFCCCSECFRHFASFHTPTARVGCCVACCKNKPRTAVFHHIKAFFRSVARCDRFVRNNLTGPGQGVPLPGSIWWEGFYCSIKIIPEALRPVLPAIPHTHTHTHTGQTKAAGKREEERWKQIGLGQRRAWSK